MERVKIVTRYSMVERTKSSRVLFNCGLGFFPEWGCRGPTKLRSYLPELRRCAKSLQPNIKPNQVCDAVEDITSQQSAPAMVTIRDLPE